jgi:CheY-like chemotaxis protein
MPKMDGLDVLEHIRKDGELRRLPVIILTTSKAEEDRLRSYDLGVNAYIVKPVGFENFSNAVRTINLFWQLVELPGGDRGPD